MKLAAAGRLHRPTPAEAWAAFDVMAARGMSVKEIALAAGLNVDSMYGMTGERKRGHQRALHPLHRSALIRAEEQTRDVQPGRCLIVGTTRRARALACMGWSTEAVAAASGLTLPQVQYVKTGPYATIGRDTANAIAAAYERLSHLDGGQRQTQGRARAAGWHPPIAWDDDTIDDPAAQPWVPNTVTIPGPLRQKHEAFQRTLSYIDAVRVGRDLDRIAYDHGVTPDAVLRHLERYGRKVLARHLLKTRARDANSHGRKTA
jgi:hypothetical protein